jgi:hypothetical protein
LLLFDFHPLLLLKLAPCVMVDAVLWRLLLYGTSGMWCGTCPVGPTMPPND